MRRHHAVAAGLLIGMGLLLVLSIREESPTTDEAFHLTRGLAYFWGPDTSLSYAHPPLGNAFAALPVVLSEREHAMGRLPGYAEGNVSEVAKALMASSYKQRREWFEAGRLAIAALTLVLGGYLYAWALALFGARTALVCLFFYATQPALIAHGRLITTDMPITFAMVASTCELARYVAGHRALHGAAAALFAGIALATKFTGIALAPITVLLVLGCALVGGGRFAGAPRSAALGRAVAYLCAWSLACLLIVNLAYRFEATGLTVREIMARPEPQNPITAPFEGHMLEQSPLRHLPAWLPVPLPYTYVLGLASVGSHDSGGHATMFLGERQSGGHWAYFPVLLAIKTPTVLLLACGAALIFFVRRKGRVSLPTLTLAWSCAALLALAMRGSINIGLRHVLPIMPELALFGAQGAVALYDHLRTFRARTAAAAALACAQLSGLAFYFPDYISDFNVLIGGKKNGERISIVGEEWGQDAIRLAKAAKARGIRKLYFNHGMFPSKGELVLRGIKVHRVPCEAQRPVPEGWIAVTARQLARDDCFGWTERYRPAFEVNNHVFVYAPIASQKDKPR